MEAYEEATQMVSQSHIYSISKRLSDNASAVFLIAATK